MSKRWVFFLGTVSLLAATQAFAANDVIKTVKGDKIEGKIRRITPTEVTIEELAGPEKVPVNEISSITFAEDPAPLKGVRVNVNKDNEQFEEALKNLSKIKVNTIERTEIKQDIDYYRAYCEARLALLGTGNVVEAGKKMRAFVTAYPDSYHYYEGCGILGDLLVAINKHSMAREYYERLNQAPWADFQMRARRGDRPGLLGGEQACRGAGEVRLGVGSKGRRQRTSGIPAPDGDSRQGPLPGHHESGRRGDPGRANGDRQGGQGGP